MPLNHGIGAIADHSKYALRTEAGKSLLVGGAADQRIWIQLPIARVQQHAMPRSNGKRLRFRNGVGNVQEFEVKGAQSEAPTQRNGDNFGIGQQSGFSQLAPQNGGDEGTRVYRASQSGPEMGDSSDVILMSMGYHQAHQLFLSVRKPSRIRTHDLGLWMFRATKTDPAIDREHGSVATVNIQIHADFAGAAEGDKGEITGRISPSCCPVLLHISPAPENRAGPFVI